MPAGDQEWDIPPIEESLNFDVADFENFGRRYFKTYRTKSGGNDEESGPQLVLVHSNRMCVICLSPEHPVVKGGMSVKKVDFQVPNGKLSPYQSKCHVFSIVLVWNGKCTRFGIRLWTGLW